MVLPGCHTGSKNDKNAVLAFIIDILDQRKPAVAQWARSMTAGTADSGYNSSYVDSSGNIYVAGYISGTQPFNFGNNVTATGTYEGQNRNFNWIYGKSVVLVKYDSSGTAQWAQTVAAGPINSEFQSVTVDSSGNIYAAGYIAGNGTFNFGNGVTATSAYDKHTWDDGNNILLMKYNSSGNAQWVQTVNAGTEASEFNSVSVNSSGNIFATGYIIGTTTYNLGNNITVSGVSTFHNRAMDSDGYNIVLTKYK